MVIITVMMKILVRLSIAQEVSLNSFMIEKVAAQTALVDINSGFFADL